MRGISRTKTGYKVNFTKNDGTRAQTSFAITRSRSKEQAKQFAIDYLESLKAGDAGTVQLGASGPRGRSNARQLAIVLDSTIESTIEQLSFDENQRRVPGLTFDWVNKCWRGTYHGELGPNGKCTTKMHFGIGKYGIEGANVLAKAYVDYGSLYLTKCLKAQKVWDDYITSTIIK